MRALNPTCREASRLLVQRRGRRLSLVERLALRMHLGVCLMCRRFDRQLEVMDDAMDQWRAYREGPDDEDGPSPR